MTRWGTAFRAAALAATLLAAGCALFTKSEPNVFRFFTPEGFEPVPEVAPRGEAAPLLNLQLRLGRVNGAEYLKDRIAYRDSSFEVGYYDQARWTEKPETYVKHALARALFERRGVREIVSGPGPALEIELEAFEEVRAPRHAVRIALTWILRDDRVVQIRETFAIERALSPGPTSTGSEVASALSIALDEAVNRISNRVTAALSSAPEGRETKG